MVSVNTWSVVDHHFDPLSAMTRCTDQHIFMLPGQWLYFLGYSRLTSINKNDCYNIAKILLIVASNTINHNLLNN